MRKITILLAGLMILITACGNKNQNPASPVNVSVNVVVNNPAVPVAYPNGTSVADAEAYTPPVEGNNEPVNEEVQTEEQPQSAPVDNSSAEPAPAEPQQTEQPATSEPQQQTTMEQDDDGENHDITKGSSDSDGNYSAYATIGSNYSVEATVDTLSSAIKGNGNTAAPLSGLTGSEDIDDARLAYHIADEDGDRDAAKDDMEDYKGIDSPSDAQISEIRNLFSDLGKLFTQFGIVAFDFNKPYDSDDTELDYDVYNSSHQRFDLAILFEGGKIVNLDFVQE